MWLRLLLLALLFRLPCEAAQLKNYSCEKAVNGQSKCRIELDGEVNSGESLFIAQVADIDELQYAGKPIGSTGYLGKNKYYARFFPRIYSLGPIVGEKNPTLFINANSLSSNEAGIATGTKIKIIDASFPMRRIYAPLAARFFLFSLIFALGFYLARHGNQRIKDGWNYPKRELRCFQLGLVMSLLLATEIPWIVVPTLVTAQHFAFLQAIAISLTLWSLSTLLLQGRFTDRSSIERAQSHEAPRFVIALIHGSFVVALMMLAEKIDSGLRLPAAFAPLVQLTALFIAIPSIAKAVEWRRARKRSGKVAFFFYGSLISLALVFSLYAIKLSLLNAKLSLAIQIVGFFALLASSWRVAHFRRLESLSQEFMDFCKSKLASLGNGGERIRALTELIQDELNAARVSFISIANDEGLLLASAGPDAIPESERKDPRALGPFLKRVCKQRHILYAPVAEELGRSLLDKGLKHSSLAIPLIHGQAVKAVICVMANEDERIPSFEATLLELAIRNLELEILSALAQTHSDQRAEQLRSIAQVANGIALEAVDHWGRLLPPLGSERRVLISAECVGVNRITDSERNSPLMVKLYRSYRMELFAIWFALREQFEFLSKDVRGDDFFAVSPKYFRNPALRELGHERASILLAHYLEKNARKLAMRDEYRALGLVGARIATGRFDLHFVARGTMNSIGIDIDFQDIAILQHLRNSARPGELLLIFEGIEALAENSSLRIHGMQRVITNGLNRGSGEIFSILSVSTDKKELRRLESLALETARESLQRKKSA